METIRPGNGKLPFKMKVCYAEGDTRNNQIQSCIDRKMDRLIPLEAHGNTLSVIGYGPSLIDTWESVMRPMITTSGAHDFMLSKGVVPDIHTDMDPRQYKTQFLNNPQKDCIYVMASCCHPDAWEKLKGNTVLFYHLYFNNKTIPWKEKNDNSSLVLISGSAAGLSAISIGHTLGFRKFECFGFDCSKVEGKRHAGSHPGQKAGHEDIEWKADGKTYISSKIMINAAFEFIRWLGKYEIKVVLHGDGLTQAMVREYDPPNAAIARTEKADRLLA